MACPGLQERHGVDGLFERLEPLSVAYQQERGDYEDSDNTRVLFGRCCK